MGSDVVAGVFVERNGGLLIRASVDWHGQSEPVVEYLDHYQFDWSQSSPAEAVHVLSQIAQLVGKSGDGLKSVGVACYGPFISLKETDELHYGKLHETNSHSPLHGQNLYEIFRAGLTKGGLQNDVPIRVQTDANALALGEAIARGTAADDVLIYIVVTDGVGAGIVSGRRILSSALHPEIGMIPIRWLPGDKLRPKRTADRYSGSLGLMANNSSLLERFQKMTRRKTPVTHMMLGEIRNPEFWEMRAYYVSQACLACTAILAPHRIVVSADVDPDGRFAERTSDQFYDFLREEAHDGEPIFEYEELNDQGKFISDSETLERVPLPSSFRVTGAFGMCQEAANAIRRPKIVTQLPLSRQPQ